MLIFLLLCEHLGRVQFPTRLELRKGGRQALLGGMWVGLVCAPCWRGGPCLCSAVLPSHCVKRPRTEKPWKLHGNYGKHCQPGSQDGCSESASLPRHIIWQTAFYLSGPLPCGFSPLSQPCYLTASTVSILTGSVSLSWEFRISKQL